MKNDGDSAFPVVCETNIACFGMSLRDYFAAQAIAGIFAVRREDSSFKDCTPEEVFRLRAETAYMAADAMLLARDK